MKPKKQITGQIFGDIKCLELVGKDRHGSYLYRCQCECGREKNIRGSDLRSGKTKSCGCKQGRFTHGLSRNKPNGKKNKLYAIWIGMRDRCKNPKSKHYNSYGGRGISVCAEWDKNYELFYSWAMANGYDDGLSIERKNNDGNYCPENCEWIEMSKQSGNTRIVKYLTINGETRSMRGWSDKTGIKKETIRGRLRNGWSAQEALTKEVFQCQKP